MGQFPGRKESLHRKVSRILPVAPMEMSLKEVAGVSEPVLGARWGKLKRTISPTVL